MEERENKELTEAETEEGDSSGAFSFLLRSRRDNSVVTEIVANMTVLMFAAVIMIALVLGWTRELLEHEEYSRYGVFIQVTYIVIFGLTVAVFGWRLISRVIVKPIRVLVEATNKVAGGDLSCRVEDLDDNEIGDLAQAFNNMTSRLERNRLELESNLTQMKDMNESLARAQREVLSSEKLASIGRLAAGVAHEIGNPLAAITGYLEIISKREYLPEGDREMVERVQSEVFRINLIIRELLDYSRPQDESLAKVSLNEAIASTLTLMKAQKDFGRVEVTLELNDVPDLLSNGSSLQQLIMNLVLNSAQAMDNGGKLSISTSREERVGKDGVLLIISDTGPGIPEEIQDRIFDPFFTTKEPGKGTGLGLSICQRIVENMKGKIDLENKEQGGSLFRIWFPLDRRSSKDHPETT